MPQNVDEFSSTLFVPLGQLRFNLWMNGIRAKYKQNTMANKTLNSAKKAKKDEFYTQLSDIENELCHYKEHFRGKTVLCNCDDPRVSNFFFYFKNNFNHLGLKRVITTCYKNQNVDLFSENKSEQAVYLVYDGDKDHIDIKPLRGDGDFRSRECIELLKQADIVVTNPPFSLFREYVAQLVEYNKKFLIIGNQNAITYKDIFPLFKNGKIWLGHGFKGSTAHFYSNYEDTATAGDHRQGMIRVSGVIWLTNLDHKKRHEDLILYKDYDPIENPNYDNYNAINISITNEIPRNYTGIMGVPITFMDKFNPDQFEILDCCEPCINLETYKKTSYFKPYKSRQLMYGGKLCQKTYHRIMIKRKERRSE